jgi:signal transduction histidine kinase
VDTAASVVVLTCLANLFLGLFVLLRNPKARLGQSFFAMAALISGWAIANYFTDNATQLTLNILFNRLAYLFAFLALVMSALFSHYFLGRKKEYSATIKTGVLIGIVVIGALSTTHYVAGTVTQVGVTLHFTSGSLILFFLAELLIVLGVIVRNLYLAIRYGTATQKNQGHIIIASFTGCIVLAIITNLIIPFLSGNNFQAAKYGPPLLTLFLTTSITYAIVTRKLFDIRLVVARSVAYSLLIFALGASYSVGAFTVGGIFFKNNTSSLAQQIYYITLALALAFTFQPLRKFFQKTTDSIFYRDHYDPDSLLNNLASIMAREIELQRLTDDVLKELTNQMRLSKASIVVTDNDKIFFEANAGTEHTKYMNEDALKTLDRSLVVRDALDPKIAPEVYKEHDIDVSVGLSSNNEFIGYLLLGHKQSGDIFNGTDIKTLRILANELAVAIHNAKSYTQIQNFNKTLQVKIEEATTQLRDANAHLKELDEIKNEFLSMATHQLNTPLAAVDGYLSMMSDGIISDPKEQHETLGKLLHRVRMMKHLVTDFLNVSRIEAGTFVIEPTPVDMNKMVTDQINELGVAAKEKEVFLQFVAPKHSLPPVEVDEQKISQAVMNLIDNAIYYTPKGNVKVYLDSDGQNAIFKVIDNGIGVPEKQKDKLFQKFARADNAKKERPNGNGVGLYLVKLVVEAHGGKIIFESTEGKGSTFGFSIPMKAKEDIEPKIQAPEPKEAVAA